MFQDRIQLIKGSLNSLMNVREGLRSKLSSIDLDLAEIDKKQGLHKEAIGLCEMCLREQSNALEYLQTHVTALLQEVFSYHFFFKFGLNLRSDGVSLKGLKPLIGFDTEEDEPDEYGDGVNNVVSFALRLLFLLFSSKLEKVMIFDEPLLNLNVSKWKAVLQFIQELQKFFPQLQIIMTTHSGAEFPQEYRVTKTGQVSSVCIA